MSDEKPKNVEVETLTSDLLNVVGDNKDGVVRKIIEEEENREKELYKKSPEYKKNIMLIVSSSLFFVLACAAVFVVFLFRKEIFTVEIAPQFKPVIFLDKTKFSDITDLGESQIRGIVLNEINSTEVKAGGVEGIYLTENKKIIGLRRFLELLEMNLDRSNIEFMKDDFLVGVVNKDGKHFFLLLRMRSMMDIFGPMREWENKMFSDFNKFFGFELNPETRYLFEKDFDDGIVQNKNARVLRDKDGQTVMMYIFLDDNYLLITNGEPATEEIIARLASAKVRK